MFHLVDVVQNRAGDGLQNYCIKLKNRTTGLYQPLFTDASGTPIATVSGVANVAKTDVNGECSFFFDDGRYDKEIYEPDGVTLARPIVQDVHYYGLDAMDTAVAAAASAVAAADETAADVVTAQNAANSAVIAKDAAEDARDASQASAIASQSDRVAAGLARDAATVQAANAAASATAADLEQQAAETARIAAEASAATATTQAGIATAAATDTAADAVQTAADRVQTGLDAATATTQASDALGHAAAASDSAVEAAASNLPRDFRYVLSGNPGMNGVTSLVINEFNQIVSKNPAPGETERKLVDAGIGFFLSKDWHYPIVEQASGRVVAGLRASGLWRAESAPAQALTYVTGASPNRELWAKVNLPGGWATRRISVPGHDVENAAPAPVQTGNTITYWDNTANELRAELLVRPPLPDGITTVVLSLAYGQSNSSYYDGRPLAPTDIADHPRSRMWNGGQIMGDQLPYELDRMTRFDPVEVRWPANAGTQWGESILPGVGHQLAAGLPSTHLVVTATAGVGGFGIAGLSPGTAPYRRLIQLVQRAKIMCDLAGVSLFIPGVIWVQGEANAATSAASYQASYDALQAAIDTDMRAITGQADAIKLIANPVSSWTQSALTTSAAQLVPAQRAIDDPTRFATCAPMYYGEDFQIHDGGVSRRHRGEQTGRAIADLLGGMARPFCYAMSAVRTGAVVQLTFPRAVTLDASIVTDPGSYGIRFTQTGGSAVTISSVAVDADPTKINVTLSATPTGTDQKIGIADLGTSGSRLGRLVGPRACIREATAHATAKNGEPLYRYVVPQSITVS